jgi:hypothetical protein
MDWKEIERKRRIVERKRRAIAEKKLRIERYTMLLNQEAVEAMTVNEIKKSLNLRRLPANGNKMLLPKRLTAALKRERDEGFLRRKTEEPRKLQRQRKKLNYQRNKPRNLQIKGKKLKYQRKE